MTRDPLTAMTTATLLAHPAMNGCVSRLYVETSALRVDGCLTLQYTATGDAAALLVPAPASAQRRDELWRHTCAELFVAAPDQDGYLEFNFSPSGEWAAYQFDGYRASMRPVECTPPDIGVWHDANVLRMTVQCHLPASLAKAAVLLLGMTMVLEDANGQCSYWALKHPGKKPDFHRREGFTLVL